MIQKEWLCAIETNDLAKIEFKVPLNGLPKMC